MEDTSRGLELCVRTFRASSTLRLFHEFLAEMSLLQFITVKNRTEALRISDYFIPALFHIHLLNPHTQARFTTLPSFVSFVNCAYVTYSPE